MRIESPQNPRVKALAALKERKERERTGRFLVEGRREVERALEAGLSLETLLLGPKARPEDRALAGGAEVLELSERALARVSARENPAQVLGVFRLPRRSLAGVTLGAAPLVLVLLGLEKPGNLGAILRAADGAGADLVLVAEGVDLFSPQVIRNSTGAVFALPVYPVAEEEAARFLEEQNLPLVAATPEGERLYWEGDYRGGVAFLLGAEDKGGGERTASTWPSPPPSSSTRPCGSVRGAHPYNPPLNPLDKGAPGQDNDPWFDTLTLWASKEGVDMAAEVKTVIKPLGDRVVVKRIEEEPKTKGGIVLPDTAKEKPQKGKVIAVGTGRVLENGQRVPLEVKEGDIVVFAKYGGTEIEIDGEEYVILSERDLLAVLQ